MDRRDNGFASAQRDYENQVPDWYDAESDEAIDKSESPDYESLCVGCDEPTPFRSTCTHCGHTEQHWVKLPD